MRHVALIALGYLLLLLVGPVWALSPFTLVAPSVPVIIAAYLGITARQSIAGPTAAAIAVGYLGDLLAGAPVGLGALVAGSACLGARLLTARLLVRGRAFVFVALSALGLLCACLTLGVRAYHGAPVGPVLSELVVALGCALLTGAFAVPLFSLCRLVDARFARTERDREAVREGFLN